ncbi:hypothetical protein [Actinoplanes sp. NPDC051859]|uniref:hypothetical protein n=1 Tax=Actinoplanes sp. NPDC051859 TaxID=3363909 RepID=UPI00379866EB
MTNEHGATAERAERLKERVYITFTALAVVLALRSHEATAEEAVKTLLIAVTGTLLAVFVADVVSHIAVHAALPARPEVQRMVRVSFGAATVLGLPLLFLGLALAETWPADRALRASTTALVVSLGVIGYLAVRRVRLPLWQKGIVLLAEVALAAAVVGLELLAHG